MKLNDLKLIIVFSFAILVIIIVILQSVFKKNTTPPVKTNDLGEYEAYVKNDGEKSILNLLPFEGDGFYIDYPYYNVITVMINNDNGRTKAEEWLSINGFDSLNYQIKYIDNDKSKTLNDFTLTKLPKRGDAYYMYFSPRVNKLVIYYKNDDALLKAKGYLQSYSLSFNDFIVEYIQGDYYENF